MKVSNFLLCLLLVANATFCVKKKDIEKTKEGPKIPSFVQNQKQRLRQLIIQYGKLDELSPSVEKKRARLITKLNEFGMQNDNRIAFLEKRIEKAQKILLKKTMPQADVDLLLNLSRTK